MKRLTRTEGPDAMICGVCGGCLLYTSDAADD